MWKRLGLRRNDDLREIIRETLQRRGVKPNKQLIEDIYTLVIKVASNSQYEELKQIVEKRLSDIYDKAD